MQVVGIRGYSDRLLGRTVQSRTSSPQLAGERADGAVRGELPGLDSNQGQGIQSPLCYHYTTGHRLLGPYQDYDSIVIPQIDAVKRGFAFTPAPIDIGKEQEL